MCLRAVGRPVPRAQLWVGLHSETLCSLEKMLWRMICQREPPAEEAPRVRSSRNGVSPAVGLTWSIMRGSSRDPQAPAVCRGRTPPHSLSSSARAPRTAGRLRKALCWSKGPRWCRRTAAGISVCSPPAPPACRQGRRSLSPGAQLKAV